MLLFPTRRKNSWKSLWYFHKLRHDFPSDEIAGEPLQFLQFQQISKTSWESGSFVLQEPPRPIWDVPKCTKRGSSLVKYSQKLMDHEGDTQASMQASPPPQVQLPPIDFLPGPTQTPGARKNIKKPRIKRGGRRPGPGRGVRLPLDIIITASGYFWAGTDPPKRLHPDSLAVVKDWEKLRRNLPYPIDPANRLELQDLKTF